MNPNRQAKALDIVKNMEVEQKSSHVTMASTYTDETGKYCLSNSCWEIVFHAKK